MILLLVDCNVSIPPVSRLPGVDTNIFANVFALLAVNPGHDVRRVKHCRSSPKGYLAQREQALNQGPSVPQVARELGHQ